MQVSVFITGANPLCRKDDCEDEVWSCMQSAWRLRALNKCSEVALSPRLSWWRILCARWAWTCIRSKLHETNSSWYRWCRTAPHLRTPRDTDRFAPLLLSHLRISQVDSRVFSEGFGNSFRNICMQQYRKSTWLPESQMNSSSASLSMTQGLADCLQVPHCGTARLSEIVLGVSLFTQVQKTLKAR